MQDDLIFTSVKLIESREVGKWKGKEPLCLGRTFSSFPPRELEVVARSAKKGLLP